MNDQTAPSPVVDMVLFGGGGDLAMRKLLPALYLAYAKGALYVGSRIIAIGRQARSQAEYVQHVEQHARQHIKEPVEEEKWQAFCCILEYVELDASDPQAYLRLASQLEHDTDRVIVCYLATMPQLFVSICDNLASVGLNRSNVRLVLEKPLGTDLASSQKINDEVAHFFSEEQIYRIDHYLGKESVQNLMVIRFANALFEPLWRRTWISDVQISVAEDLGVGTRAEFYDSIGAMRDVVQNHLVQLLCIVAMEIPANLEANSIRDEKLKVLKALKAFTQEDVINKTVRGQYKAGAVAGKPVKGYLEEKGIPPHSQTETFVAIKAEINNWRWAGVPFFLRTGKRMQERVAEIVINFREVPHQLFPGTLINCHQANRLVIRLQPDESIRLYFWVKKSGNTMDLQQAYLDLDFSKAFKAHRADAYERLLLDVIRGDLTLFVRRDETAEAWRWVEPIMETWRNMVSYPPRPYTAGTWGPAASSALLSRDGVNWHEEC